ncbi:MAG: hypothetical protein WCK67_03680 [bacterium]
MVSKIDNSKLFEKFALKPQQQQAPAPVTQQAEVVPVQVQKEMEGVQAKTHEPKQDELNIGHASDHMVSNDALTKMKVQVEKTSKLPEYAIRGMKGDQDANFYEFLELGKVPYFLGGAVLTACYAAGGKGAAPFVTRMGAGAAFFYTAAMLGKNAIALPVQLLRGIDLNHPYRDIVDCRAVDAQGTSPKKKEYHKVFESIDFTRWDLLENHEKGDVKNNPRLINAKYDRIAKKMGIKEKDLNDSDSTLRAYIKKTLVMSKAAQYMSIALFAPLAIGVANVREMESLGHNMFGDIAKHLAKPKADATIASTTKDVFSIIKSATTDVIGRSFKSLWTGEGNTHTIKGVKNTIGSVKTSDLFKQMTGGEFFQSLNGLLKKHGGKALILAPLVTSVAANAWIYFHTNAGKKKVLPAAEFAIDKQRLAEQSAQGDNTQQVKPQ